MTDPRYSTKRWRKLREQAKTLAGWRCTVPGCKVPITTPRMLHADHIDEAKDDGAFYSLANIQVLCKIHHDQKTVVARAKRLGRGRSPFS